MKDETANELADERTLLAAERTFSAWIRTGLAGIGGGLAVVRLITFRSTAHQLAAHIIGALLILWGASIFVFAFLGYRRTWQTLESKGIVTHSAWILILVTAVLVVVGMLILWITLMNFDDQVR